MLCIWGIECQASNAAYTIRTYMRWENRMHIYLWFVYSCKKHSEWNTNCERKKVDKASSVVAAATCARAVVAVDAYYFIGWWCYAVIFALCMSDVISSTTNATPAKLQQITIRLFACCEPWCWCWCWCCANIRTRLCVCAYVGHRFYINWKLGRHSHDVNSHIRFSVQFNPCLVLSLSPDFISFVVVCVFFFSSALRSFWLFGDPVLVCSCEYTFIFHVLSTHIQTIHMYPPHAKQALAIHNAQQQPKNVFSLSPKRW